MTAPIGLQLYSVREYLTQDFAGVTKRIAKMGYTGVETWNFPEGLDPKDAKNIFDDLGLTVTSSHSPLPLGDDKQQVLDALNAIGCPHLVSASMDPDYYSSEDKMKGLAEIFNQAAEVAAENGMKFSIHNHDFEYASFNGSPAIYTLMKYLEPGINFELDTYWIKVAGVDPAEVVTRMGDRSPLLHIKDGPATKEGDMTAVGDGVVDVPSIIKAGKPITEWLIVELDRCATDMMEALEKSCQYLAQIND
jgi:sugar phosphate isomerase/epimerase